MQSYSYCSWETHSSNFKMYEYNKNFLSIILIFFINYIVSCTGVKTSIDLFHKNLEEQIGYKIDYKASKETFEKVIAASIYNNNNEIIYPNDITLAPRGGLNNSSLVISGELRSSCLDSFITGTIINSTSNNIIDDKGGIIGILLECISNCNSDIKSLVSNSIIICGGGSTISNVNTRIIQEANIILNQLRDNNMKNDEKLNNLKANNNKLINNNIYLSMMKTPFVSSSLSWIGGSLFSSLKV